VNGLCGTIYAQGKRVEFDSLLVGKFNVKNILAAVGAALCLDLNENAIGRGVNGASNVPGRMEKVGGTKGAINAGQFAVFVDYAHSPDALENVLHTLNALEHKSIIVVFGCGGDRDQGKRFLMGEIAGRLADIIVVTADNSRSEKSTDIMAEICRGVEAAGKTKTYIADGKLGRRNGYVAVVDRSEAISVALHSAAENDIVLVSGKGHENYQVTKAGSIFFDDRQEVRRWLEKIH
jgi:UDP-N-acetylmuramyl-tripeptide synthetase